jgi:hypothetical protein
MADDIKSKIVIENQQDVKDVLLSLAGTLSAAFKDALTEAFEPDTFKFIERDLTRNLKKAADLSTIIAENAVKLGKGTASAKDIAAQLEKAQIQSSAINRQKDKLLKQLGEEGILASETYKAAADYSKILDEEIAKLQEQADQSEKINKNLGITGELFNGLSKSLQKFGINSSILDTIKTKLNLTADSGQVSFSKASKIIREELTKALEDPLVRFTIGLKAAKSGFNDIKKAFNVFLEYDKIFVDTARNLGLSEEKISGIVAEAKAADTAIKGINGQTFNTLYTAAQLAKSFAEVNNQLGLSVDIGAKSLDEFTAMTNQMGLSADEATNIYKIGLLNNMSLEDTNKAIISGVVATQKSTGVQVNARQVLQEIGKLSAGITSKFQQNPAALAQAVTQAKALGTTLEQVDKVGESLLNFESSIENELKAELLTGKQINLEKARYAALTGDQSTLTQELANQVGSLADFQGMNVIAQKSLAEAFGLSRDEVADMLTKQETFNKLGDVSKKSAAEQLAIAKERGLSETDSLVVNLKQQAASEKIASAFDNFKSAAADILIGLRPLLDMFVSLSKNTGLVYSALVLVAGISFAKTIGGLILMASQLGLIASAKAVGAGADGASATAMAIQAGAANKLVQTEAIITAEKTAQAGASITTAAASSIINPIAAVAGLVAAAAAVAFIANAAMTKPKLKDGAVVMPTPGGTDVTIGEGGSPEAVIPLNSSKANSMMGGMDLTPLTNIMTEVKNAISSLAARPIYTTITLDGRALGTAVGSQQETGEAQMMKTSYRLA